MFSSTGYLKLNSVGPTYHRPTWYVITFYSHLVEEEFYSRNLIHYDITLPLCLLILNTCHGVWHNSVCVFWNVEGKEELTLSHSVIT